MFLASVVICDAGGVFVHFAHGAVDPAFVFLLVRFWLFLGLFLDRWIGRG